MHTAIAPMLESNTGEAVALTGMSVKAGLRDLFSDVTVEQRYENRERVNIEAVYTFPLPLDAVLLDLKVIIGERELIGQVVEKKQAEERYEDAVTDGDRAVMLEQSAPGLYTMNVGNLLPGEFLTVRYRFSILLRWNGDTIRFHLPTTIAPRYGDPSSMGMAPHQIPDYTVSHTNDFRIDVEVLGLLHAQDTVITSPSHKVTTVRSEDKTLVQFQGEKAAMDRDFILSLVSPGVAKASAVCEPDLDGMHAVLASFCPSFGHAAAPIPRNIKIVVDCSGSMMGDSIDQARKALGMIIGGLKPADHFNITAFGSTHRSLFDCQMLVNEETLTSANRFLASMNANMGGTEIGGALNVLYAHKGPDGPPDVLLITDGEVWDRGDVLNNAKKSGHRIFTVGVGSSVSEPVVRGLSDMTGGACELVSPNEDMAARIHRHFKRIYLPKAASTRIVWTNRKPIEQVPASLDQVYDGDTIHVFALFSEQMTGDILLEVTLEGGQRVNQEASVAQVATESVSTGDLSGSISRLAAHSRMDCAKPDKALGLALRYQLMSDKTNYLIVDAREEGDRAKTLPELRKVPQTLAAGWHGAGSVYSECRVSMCSAMPVANREAPSENMNIPCYMRKRREDAEDISASEPPPLVERKVVDKRSSKKLNMPNEDFFEIPAFIRRDERIADEVERAAKFLRTLSRSMPARAILGDRLTLAMLTGAGLEEEVVEKLRGMVSRNRSEHEIVLCFLYTLLENRSLKSLLPRETCRAILKGYKMLASQKPTHDLKDALKDVWPMAI
jgi:Ca-activated chloride channel homolog